MAQKRFCEVPGCGNELTAGCGSHGGPLMCSRCRSALAYARAQKDPEWATHRKERLEFLTERHEYLSPIVSRLIKRGAQRLSEARARARAAH